MLQSKRVVNPATTLGRAVLFFRELRVAVFFVLFCFVFFFLIFHFFFFFFFFFFFLVLPPPLQFSLEDGDNQPARRADG
jgi:hypothetical protein